MVSDDTEIFPAFRYERDTGERLILGAPEAEAEARAHMTFVNDMFQQGPSTRLVKLRDVFVHEDRILAVRQGEVFVIAETSRRSDEGSVPFEEPSAAHLRASATSVTAPNPLYIGSPGFKNYGHWLLDDLPRIAALPHIARKSGRGADIVLRQSNATLDDSKRASIHLAAPAGSIASTRFTPRESVLHFDELWFVTPPTLHPALKSPAACGFLRAMARGLAGGRPSRNNAIFVAREHGYGRILVNEAEILGMLGSMNIEVVHPDRMSFVQQATLFSGARQVVGSMGAAMTNMVFCEAGVKAIHLAPDGWTEPFYWDLACASGQSYCAIYGPSQPDCPPHRRNYRIDPRLLKRGIEAWASGGSSSPAAAW